MHPLGRKCNCICKKHKITGRNVLYALQKGVVYSVLQIIQNIFTFLDGSANNLQNEKKYLAYSPCNFFSASVYKQISQRI